MTLLLHALIAFLPWRAKRLALNHLFGFRIHENASIGLSIVAPEHLVMADGSRIGHLNVCRGLQGIEMADHARMGNLNWVTGYPAGGSGAFSHEGARSPRLVVGRHAAVTNRHYIDCTNLVEIGEFSTVAGLRSQLLTHEIDFAVSRQGSQPIKIGDYCFVSSSCVLLGGAVLPDFSVLGAGALLERPLTDTHTLYAGVPARAIKQLPRELGYFKRPAGFVE